MSTFYVISGIVKMRKTKVAPEKRSQRITKTSDAVLIVVAPRAIDEEDSEGSAVARDPGALKEATAKETDTSVKIKVANG